MLRIMADSEYFENSASTKLQPESCVLDDPKCSNNNINVYYTQVLHEDYFYQFYCGKSKVLFLFNTKCLLPVHVECLYSPV